MEYCQTIVHKVCNALLNASSSFRPDKERAYIRAIEQENNESAKWVMETILENAAVAKENCSPLCDDTGVPHVLVELGPKVALTGMGIASIEEGIRQGLRRLPGRPMAVRGDDGQRLAQSVGMYEDPGMLLPAPFLIRPTEEDVLRIHVLMFGGGPAIRAHTHRVFHKHQMEPIIDQIVDWAVEGAAQLGCTPCTLAVGVGRSHYEASALMLQALVDGSYNRQSKMEQEITCRVNNAKIGALGLGGDNSVLATFMKVGPQRASGVRVVCMRPCCCFEPRIASCEI